MGNFEAVPCFCFVCCIYLLFDVMKIGEYDWSVRGCAFCFWQVRFTDRWHVLGRWGVRPQRLLSKTRRRNPEAAPTSVCSTTADLSPPVRLFHLFMYLFSILVLYSKFSSFVFFIFYFLDLFWSWSLLFSVIIIISSGFFLVLIIWFYVSYVRSKFCKLNTELLYCYLVTIRFVVFNFQFVPKFLT